MKNHKLLFFLTIPVFLISSCCDCFTPPQEVSFNIISAKGGPDLIFNKEINKDSISIYYLENNSKVNVEFELFTDSVNQKVIIQSGDISNKSADGQKSFFLYLNSHDVNTMYLDVEEVKDGCCTFYSLNEFKINNSVLLTSSNNGLYEFVK